MPKTDAGITNISVGTIAPNTVLNDKLTDILTELGRLSCFQHETNQRTEVQLANLSREVLYLSRRTDSYLLRVVQVEKENASIKKRMKYLTDACVGLFVSVCALSAWIYLL